MQTKQIIVMRADLEMDAGKVGAQTAHASFAFVSRQFRKGHNDQNIFINDVEREWFENSFTKIVVWVYSEEELMEMYYKALDEGIMTHLVVDNGATVFNGVKTRTCVALGPDIPENLDPIVGHLSTTKSKAKVKQAKRASEDIEHNVVG